MPPAGRIASLGRPAAAPRHWEHDGSIDNPHSDYAYDEAYYDASSQKGAETLQGQQSLQVAELPSPGVHRCELSKERLSCFSL